LLPVGIIRRAWRRPVSQQVAESFHLLAESRRIAVRHEIAIARMQAQRGGACLIEYQ